MKKKITTIILIGIFLLSALGSSTATTSNTEATQIDIGLKFSQPQVSDENEEYCFVEMSETETVLMEPGQPMLPRYTETFTFPFGTIINQVTGTVVHVREEPVVKKVMLAPESVPVGYTGMRTVKEDTRYDYKMVYPDRWYEYDVGTGLDGSDRCVFVKLDVYPVQYHPADNVLQWIDTIQISIDYQLPSCPLVFPEEYSLVVLVPAEYVAAIAPLVAHKITNNVTARYVLLEEIYGGAYFPVTGRDEQEQIKYFIKNTIEQWGTTNILLVGGSAKFPTRDTHITVSEDDDEIFVSDLYYADIYDGAGGFSSWDTNNNDNFAEYEWEDETDELDLYPDVYIGRLPCVDANEVTTIVNKIITYETTEAHTQNWFTNLVVIGGDTVPGKYGDEAGVDEGEYLNQAVMDVMDGFIPDIIWDSNGRLSGIAPTGVDNINEGINNGCGFVDFSGHGAPWIWTTFPHNGSYQSLPTPLGQYTNGRDHIQSLSNGDKLPIVMCGGCSLGKYTVNPNCFAWAFLANPSGGGIASFGATGLGYVYIGEGVTQGLFEGMMLNAFKAYKQQGAITFGEMWGKAISSYIHSRMDGGDYKTLEEFQAFGDPTLAIADQSLPPQQPLQPSGPTSGNIQTEYTYSTSTTDPDDDQLYYLFDWSDGSYSGWIGPYNSGATVEARYTWTKTGTYDIRVKAKDEHGVQGPWSDPLPVSMPRSKQGGIPSTTLWLVKGLFKYLEEDEEYVYLKALSAKLRGFGNGASAYRLFFCPLKLSKPLHGIFTNDYSIVVLGVCNDWYYL